jgi:putative peptide zinc metalloprotease protein
MIEDPVTSKFHRLGLAEYRLITHFDGKTTFAEAFARASLQSGSEALSEREAVAVLHWLVENHLADFGQGLPEEVLAKKESGEIKARIKNWANVLFIRVPLGRPDEWLAKIAPRLSMFCGWPFFGLWCVVLLIGILQVGWNWGRFVRGTEGILGTDNWVWLGLVWVLLKLWHEFWHGLVCKHYGGVIREAGVLFILFTPMGYVDASSSWAFPSKWRRMHVAAAGMFGELFIAALAAMVWGMTGPGLANTLAMNTMIMASTVTLLFNLNPLMRFDGYFILSDWLEIPNLGPKATQLLKQLAKRWLLGVSQVAEIDWKDRQTFILLAYGLAAMLWRLMVFVTLMIAASLLFKGGGLILAVIAFGFWAWPMISSLFLYLKDGHGAEKVVPLVAVARVGGLLLLILAILWIPISVTIRAHGLIQYAGEVIVRAEGSGTVVGIHVREGERVAAGQILVTLRNPELETELERLAVRYDRQLVRSRLVQKEKEVAVYDAELATLESFRKQYEEKRKVVETLDIVAPSAGRVVAGDLERLRGRYLKTGDEVVRVANESGNEVAVPIRQDEIDWFRRHVGFPVEIRVDGRRGRGEGILRRVTGKASVSVDHPALTSLGGGPLPVKKKGSDEGASREQESSYELVEPVFWATVDVTGSQEVDLRSGEPARVKFVSREKRNLAGTLRAGGERLLTWLISRGSAS